MRTCHPPLPLKTPRKAVPLWSITIDIGHVMVGPISKGPRYASDFNITHQADGAHEPLADLSTILSPLSFAPMVVAF